MIDKFSLERDGFVVSEKVFSEDELRSLNNLASTIVPYIGMCKRKGWINNNEAHLPDIDWAYYWSETPDHNTYINETILPVLASICDDLLGVDNWGWQMTNRYIISNCQHDYPVYPHFDAPYLWPQKLDVQMAKYLEKGVLSLTFMIPLMEFVPENGATGFVPGTHNYIHDTIDWNESQLHRQTFFNDNCVQPEVPLGSFSCFYGNCLHSVMSNKTDVIRRGIIFRGIRNDALAEMSKFGLG